MLMNRAETKYAWPEGVLAELARAERPHEDAESADALREPLVMLTVAMLWSLSLIVTGALLLR